VYLGLILPGISSLLGHELKGEYVDGIYRIYSKQVDILIDADRIFVLRVPEKQLDLTGDYQYSDDFDFVRVLVQVFVLLFDLDNSRLYDMMLFKHTPNWRDFISRIAFVFEMETELISNGIYIQDIGEFTEEAGLLYLRAIDLFEYSWEPREGEIFKEGVLSLMSTVYPSKTFIQTLLSSLGEGGDDYSEGAEEEPGSEASMGGEAGGDVGGYTPEGGDMNIDMAGEGDMGGADLGEEEVAI
jgi:hypothetical protein